MKSKACLTVITALASLVALPAMAQDNSSSNVLEEVTVTAQRREQSLLEVPISISVFEAEEISRGLWQGARDFVLLTPNVFMTENDQQGTKNGDISIRGISDLTAGANERIIQTRPAIGFYVDDVSVASVSSGAANPPLGDVERIEVLRGPQVTYFGRSAAGGAVNVITKKPDEHEMYKVKAGFGNFDTYHVGAIGNIPLADNFFARAGISYLESGGLVKNLSPTGNDSDTEFLNGRLAFRWQPGDWTVDLTGQITREDEGNLGRIGTGFITGGPSVPVTGNPPKPQATCGLGSDIFYPGNDRYNCEDANTFTSIDNEFFSLRAHYDAGAISFTSITGYLTSDFGQLEDIDNSGMDVFSRLNDYTSDSFTQEFRVSSIDPIDFASVGINWTVGAAYYDDQFNTNNRIITGKDVVPVYVATLTVPGDRPNENSQFVNRDGWAIFADMEIAFNEAWSLNVGGRYSDDNDEQYWTDTYAAFTCGTRLVTNGVPAPMRAGCALRPDQTEPLPIYQGVNGLYYVTGGRFAQTQFTSGENDSTDFSPRVALNWRVNDDQSAYLTYSEGYRPAGVRVNPDQQQNAGPSARDLRSFFDKEQITNYELGWKGYLADRKLLLEAAVFHMDWEDMQIRVSRTLCREPDGSYVPIDSGSPQCEGLFPDNTVRNAESAESSGAEVSVTALLTEQLTLSGSAGYLDTEFTDFKNSQIGDVTGLPMPYSPEWSASGAAQYDWTAGETNGYVRLVGAYKDETFVRFQDIKQPRDSVFLADSYVVFNFGAGVTWGRNSFDLTINNLFDEEYIASIESTSSLGPVVLPHPRIWTLTWTAEFGGQ